MKEYIAVAAMLLMPLTVSSSPTWASMPQNMGAKKQAMAPTKLWGTVVSFDAAKNQLTIKDRHGKTEEVQLAADSKLTKGGNNEKIAAKDLKANSSVVIILNGNMAKAVHWNVNAGKAGKSPQAKNK